MSALPDALRDRLLEMFGTRPRAVVGIAGESGSGKSVTAVALAESLAAVGRIPVVLHQDDYFHLPPRTNHEARVASLSVGDLARVGPQEVDLARLAAHVAAFCAGADGVVAPAVDYPGNRFVERHLDFSRTDVLIVEGTYVLTLSDLDARVFLDATYEDTRERRRARARDVDAPIVERVLAIEHAIVTRQRDAADVVIDRAFAIVR